MSNVLDGLRLVPVRIPMRHRFRGVDYREAVLIEGPSGWGEFSPFPEYPPEVAVRWLAAALELATGRLDDPVRAEIPVNATVPAVDPGTAVAIVSESGASTAKVKIGEPGQAESDDFSRVRAVRDALGSAGRVRVDVNAAWDVETATARLTNLAVFDLEYAEQPVRTIEEMVELRRRVPIKLAADELIRQSSDPLRVVEEGGADIAILKVQPMGGVAGVLHLARQAGVPVVISSAVETSVGMYGGLLAASLLDHLPYACGLGTVGLIGGDPTRDPLVPDEGVLEVRRPEPDPDLLAHWKPADSRSKSMLRRVRAAAKLLP